MRNISGYDTKGPETCNSRMAVQEPPLLCGLCSRPPSGCLKPRAVLNLVYTLFFSYTHPLPLKGSTYGSSWACLSCRGHGSCFLGSSLGKMMVTRTEPHDSSV